MNSATIVESEVPANAIASPAAQAVPATDVLVLGSLPPKPIYLGIAKMENVRGTDEWEARARVSGSSAATIQAFRVSRNTIEVESGGRWADRRYKDPFSHRRLA